MRKLETRNSFHISSSNPQVPNHGWSLIPQIGQHLFNVFFHFSRLFVSPLRHHLGLSSNHPSRSAIQAPGIPPEASVLLNFQSWKKGSCFKDDIMIGIYRMLLKLDYRGWYGNDIGEDCGRILNICSLLSLLLVQYILYGFWFRNCLVHFKRNWGPIRIHQTHTHGKYRSNRFRPE